MVADVSGLGIGKSTLSVLTNERGGIVDDTVVAKAGADRMYVVTNAGCRDKDLAHFKHHLAEFLKAKPGRDVRWAVHDERALLALQGPMAASILQKLVDFELSRVGFGGFIE